jgi:UDP:flavonoid glycosyltransferase YjiC (YdhE family)
MRIALLTYGTRGDVQPLVAVADRLRRAGHEAVLAAPVNLVPMVAAAGFDAVPIPIDTQAFFLTDKGKRILASGNTTRFVREVGRVERENRDAFDESLIAAASGADLLVASVLTMTRAACIVEASGQPLLLASTVPLEPTGAFPSPYLVGGDVPRWLRRPTHQVFERVFWTTARGNVRAMRRRLGLREQCPNLLARVRHEGVRNLHLLSPVLLPRPADWPGHLQVVGSVKPSASLRSAWGEDTLAPELDAWMGDGPAPVYLGFGSMPVLDPPATLALIGEVTARLGVRGLVGAGWSDIPEGAAHDGRVYVAPAFDHDAVLPRCSAALHHGGAGTAHTVLRAGLPNVVASVFADQPLWGHRMEALGIGATMPYPKVTADRLVAALGPLLRPEVKERAEALAADMADEDGAGALVAAAERAATVVTG